MQSPAWIDVTAHDAEAARRFYGALLGWDVHVLPDLDYGVVAAGPGRLPAGIGQARPEGLHPAGVVVYFTVDDLASAVDRAVQLGASVAVVPWTLAGLGTMVVLLDPEGQRIGLWEPEIDESSDSLTAAGGPR